MRKRLQDIAWELQDIARETAKRDESISQISTAKILFEDFIIPFSDFDIMSANAMVNNTNPYGMRVGSSIKKKSKRINSMVL